MTSILITGGIGDFLALESFFSCPDVEIVYHATHKHKEIQELIESYSIFPSAKHIVAWDDFSEFWCFHTKKELLTEIGQHPCATALDWSIASRFNVIKRGDAKFKGSSCLLRDLGKRRLPEEYMVVCPFTSDKRDPRRDFDDGDWEACRKLLRGRVGVILNKGDEKVQKGFLDLSNQTSLAEAVEILKGARGYIGVDTWLSVLAAQLFSFPEIMVKSLNFGHLYKNLVCYYSPHSSFGFVQTSINTQHSVKVI